MKIVILRAAMLAGAVFAAGAYTPASAASAMTEAFLANAAPNVDFLDRSSRMASDHTKNVRLKDFAHSGAREATLAANAMDEWIETTKTHFVAVAAADDEGVITGRSAAIDGKPATQIVDNRLPMGQEDLDRLDGLSNGEFDAMLKEKQLDALNQLQTDYADYIAKGDDPILLGMAQKELPKVKKRLAALRKM